MHSKYLDESGSAWIHSGEAGQSEAPPSQLTQSYIWPRLVPEKEMLCRNLGLLWRRRERDLCSAVSVGTAGSTGYCPLLVCGSEEEEGG